MPVPIAAMFCSMLGCLLHTLSSADLPSEESGAASTLMPSKEPLRDFSSQLGMRPTAGCAAPDHAATSVLIEPPGYHIAKAGAPGRTGLHEREPPRGEPVAHTWERAAFSDASWSTSRNCFSSSASSLSLLSLSCATCRCPASSDSVMITSGQVIKHHAEWCASRNYFSSSASSLSLLSLSCATC